MIADHDEYNKLAKQHMTLSLKINNSEKLNDDDIAELVRIANRLKEIESSVCVRSTPTGNYKSHD